tara:strand:- start:737 stop:895 length:159 start_codon:yes stop_codon:yes gene_type:complete
LYAGRGFYNKETTMKDRDATHVKIAKAILWFFATAALGIWFSRIFSSGWGMG